MKFPGILSFFLVLITVGAVKAQPRPRHQHSHHFMNINVVDRNSAAEGGADLKTRWAELTAVDADQAVEQIQKERPELKLVKVKVGSMVTMDYRGDRVRVWYDPTDNRVTAAPKIG